MSASFQVSGRNPAALFTLKVHRGDGMALLAMNWKKARPPADFVGFAIEYKEPGGDRFFTLNNRLSFADAAGKVSKNAVSSRLAPIQKFRWVHFPRNAELAGDFLYRVTPVFMNADDVLSYGEAQDAALELRRETYPGQLNVAFTRGFVSSQAFVDRYGADSIPQLLPDQADGGLEFVPTHSKADEAHAWMGFEARSAILEVLDQAIADPAAQVRVVAYDLNLPAVVSRLEQLGARLKILIDDDGAHGEPDSAETKAAQRLVASAGAENVKRQHLGKLQHNKTIVVDGPKARAAVCGSTNYSWRGFFVQNNSAIVVRSRSAVKAFRAAFEDYWAHSDVAGFGQTASAKWNDLHLADIDAQIGFSPRTKTNAALQAVADDIANHTTSSLFFSLAFLYQTPGAIRDAVKKVREDGRVFSYGISDHRVPGIDGPEAAGLDLQKPGGKVTTVQPAALRKGVPPPFSAEPVGGGGTRMHHKFVVIDFNKPTARVYVGSYNFSKAADASNGENLLLIRNRRIAVSYVVEALRIFDHYHFRSSQETAKAAGKPFQLARPPRAPGEKPWWDEHFTDARKILDRELFA